MTIYRIVLEERGSDLPMPYRVIDQKAFKTIALAEAAVAEAYELTYRSIPPGPGATCGPTHEREYFSKTVRFPLVSIREEHVGE